MSVSGDEAQPAGRLIAGRYQLLHELGRGGMGVVWQAEDQLVRRMVAVKELRPPAGLPAAERDIYQQRGLAEARSAAQLVHPGAATLFDVLPSGGPDDTIYLIMELIRGQTLAQLIETRGPLPEAAVAAIGLQLVSVLQAAHTLGVVHRDIKPGNIMITASHTAKLTDFGIAHILGDTRLTGSGVMGTQAYMAPELFDGAPITPAADLWSLGVTLFTAVAGHSPFDRENAGATLRAILLDQVPAPPCSQPLATAITSMLRRDPAQRATTAQAGASLQAACQASASQPAPPLAGPRTPWEQAPTARSPRPAPQLQPPHSARPARPGRRATVIIAASAAVVVLAAAAVIVGVLVARQPRPAPGRPSADRSSAAQPSPGPRPRGLLTTFTNPDNNPIDQAAFSPDGKTIAVAIDGELDRCTLATHKQTTVQGNGSQLFDPDGVAYSPDGTTLALAEQTGGTDLLNAATGAGRATLTDPDTDDLGVTAVAISHDGTKLAAYDGNGSIYLWDLARRRITATLTGPDSDQLPTMAFSPDGRMLAVPDGSDNSTHLFSTATGRPAGTLTDPGGHQARSVSFSPDGRTLAVADGSTYLWDVSTRAVIATFKTTYSDATWASFSPDGKILAVIALSGDDVYLWNVSSHTMTATLDDPKLPAASSVMFSPDGQLLAVTSGAGIDLWSIAEAGG